MSNEHLHININRGIVLIGNKSEVPTTQTHSSPGWLDSTSTSTSFTKHAEIRNISLFDSNQVVLIILIIIKQQCTSNPPPPLLRERQTNNQPMHFGGWQTGREPQSSASDDPLWTMCVSRFIVAQRKWPSMGKRQKNGIPLPPTIHRSAYSILHTRNILFRIDWTVLLV